MRARISNLTWASVAGIALSVSSLNAQERFSLPGPEVTLYNLAGTLQVVAGSGSTTEVEITRIGRDAARLQVERGAAGSGSVLRVIYPADDIIYSRMSAGSMSSLSVNADGTFGRESGARDRTVRITGRDRAAPGAVEMAADIIVRVPQGVRLNASVAVGEASVTGVNSPVRVSTSSGGITASNVRGQLGLRTASGRIEARNVEGDVELRTASGGVRLEDVRGNALRVLVASGGIEASRVSAPEVELRTSSGRVRAEEVRADRLTLRSSSGGVTARALTVTEANISTASGSIDVEFTGGLRAAEISAASGSVTLRVPESFGASLELRSASGDIRVDAPVSVMSQRRGHMTGTIGDGSARITARSSSGGVTITRR